MKFSFSRKEQADRHESGVWVSLDDEKYNYELLLDDPKDGPAVKLASKESRRYQEVWEAGVAKHTKIIQAMRRLPPHLATPLEEECLAACTLEWVGVRDEDGQPVPFSRGAALQALQQSKVYKARVRDVVNDLAAFEKETEVADVENLSRSSVINSNGAVAGEADQPGMTPLH